MEDASLDDFFAKKDKSKKKSKIKSGDGEELAKSSSVSSSKKEKKKDKDKINSSNSSTNKTQEKKQQPADDEWNDFEEEKAVDYSGLRIQNLQQKEDVDREGDGEEEELDENGEVRERKDGASGPWNKSSAVGTSGVIEEEKAKPAPAPASTGKYIPPSQRAGAVASSGMPSNSRRKKELPNVHSDIDFPTLAVGPGQVQGQLQSNNTGGQGTSNHGKGVTLENKFSVLGD